MALAKPSYLSNPITCMRPSSFYLVLSFLLSVTASPANIHLRVATYNNPLANVTDTPVNTIGLIESDIFELLTERLNFTYEIRVPSDILQLGLPIGNGSWNGVLGLIHRNEADVSVTFGPRTLSRYLAFDVSTHVITDTVAIMTPYPKSDLHPTSLLKVFTTAIWVIFSVLTWTVMFFVWLTGRAMKRNRDTFETQFLYFAGVCLTQGGWLRQDSTATRLVISSWLFSFGVLYYAYNGGLIAKLSAPKYEFLVKSLDDIAANEKIMPMIRNASSTHNEFRESILPSFKAVNSRLEKHPELLLPNANGLVEVLLNRTDSVFMMSDLLLHDQLEIDRDKTGTCRAYILENVVSIRRNSLFLQKHSKWTPIINRQLLLFRDHGLSQYLEQKRKPACSKRCAVNERAKRAPAALTFHQMKFSFYALAVGLVASLLVFFVELLAKCLSK